MTGALSVGLDFMHCIISFIVGFLDKMVFGVSLYFSRSFHCVCLFRFLFLFFVRI